MPMLSELDPSRDFLCLFVFFVANIVRPANHCHKKDKTPGPAKRGQV